MFYRLWVELNLQLYPCRCFRRKVNGALSHCVSIFTGEGPGVCITKLISKDIGPIEKNMITRKAHVLEIRNGRDNPNTRSTDST